MTAVSDWQGKDAFIAAGWTLPVWEAHIKKIIDIHKKHTTKPLMMFTAQSFLGTQQDYRLKNQMNTAKRVLGYAAEQGVSILFQVLSATAGEFEDSKALELVAHLATLSPPAGFSIGFGDDWPLYSLNPGLATAGRDINGFEKELKDAIAIWDGIGRKYPLFFVFREPEANATNKNGSKFEQAVYDMVVRYLSNTPPTANAEADQTTAVGASAQQNSKGIDFPRPTGIYPFTTQMRVLPDKSPLATNSTPTGLRATAISQNQINLSWMPDLYAHVRKNVNLIAGPGIFFQYGNSNYYVIGAVMDRVLQ